MLLLTASIKLSPPPAWSDTAVDRAGIIDGNLLAEENAAMLVGGEFVGVLRHADSLNISRRCHVETVGNKIPLVFLTVQLGVTVDKDP